MPNSFLTKREYETVLQWLEEFNIEDGFFQELVTGSEWLPDFNRPNPFLSELSVPVWHFSS
jgi:putative pyruvate formate lyase activating enzyme